VSEQTPPLESAADEDPAPSQPESSEPSESPESPESSEPSGAAFGASAGVLGQPQPVFAGAPGGAMVRSPYDPHPLAAREADSPFLWKLILCFLIVDGFERLAELVLYALALRAGPGAEINPYAPNVYVSALWILVDFLLATLLGLRARAGRIWTLGIFAIHLFYLGHVLAVRYPYLWVYLGDAGRTKILVTMVIDVLAIFWLLSPQSKRTLFR
jgi:hypothetical protein